MIDNEIHHHHKRHEHHHKQKAKSSSSLTNIYLNARKNATNRGKGSKEEIKDLSCNELFSYENFQMYTMTNTTDLKCLRHQNVPTTHQVCQLGSITIDKSQINGGKSAAVGGEDLDELLLLQQRDLSILKPNQLQYSKGVLTFHNDETKRQWLLNNNNNSNNNFRRSYSDGMMKLLETDLLGSYISKEIDDSSIPALAKTTNRSPTTALLIHRGDYANPCMSMLDMYNVWIIMEKFKLLESSKTLIWLDDHPKGNLDEVWKTLFTSTNAQNHGESRSYQHLYHVKQLPYERTTFDNAIAVNTKSVIGEEGLNAYWWRRGRTNNTVNCTMDPNTNTLVAFRNFVLQKYGMERKSLSSSNSKRLTLLVRRHYKAHLRSNGRTDRVLANVTNDVEYLKSIHPEYANNIHVVSFENLPFKEQLQHITQTDLFLAVHGAGNIHTLFLPDHATFIEYFPKNYQHRMRFRYFAECLNLTYVAKHAWIVERFEHKTKVEVQLQPRNQYEEGIILWHTQ